jgi:hypothetical protein
MQNLAQKYARAAGDLQGSFDLGQTQAIPGRDF